MAPTSSQWATVLPIIEKASGKELFIAAAPVLLAIQGFLDEMFAVVIGFVLVTAIFFLRKYLNSHAEDLSNRITIAREEGALSQDAAASALGSLKRLTASAAK